MDPATISAIMAAIGPILQSLTGKDEKFGSTFNPQQQQFMSQGLNQLNPGQGDITNNANYQQGSDWLSNLFNDPEFFKNFSAPLFRQFEEEIGPNLANRYAGMGSGGATGSTGFRNQIIREGGNLQEKIAALKGGMQQQGVNQSLQYAQQPASNYFQQMQQLLQPTNNIYQPSSY